MASKGPGKGKVLSLAGLRQRVVDALPEQLVTGFRDLAGVKPITTSGITKTPDEHAATQSLAMPNHQYRSAYNLDQKSERYSPNWAERIEAANVLYGTFASIERMASGQASTEQAQDFEKFVSSIITPELELEEAGSVIRIASKLITAEKGGLRDLAQAGISAQDMQVLSVAMNVLEQDIGNDLPAANAMRDALKAEEAKAQKKISGLNGGFNARLNKARHKENVQALAEIQAQTARPIDFAVLQSNATTANGYLRRLSADLAHKLNPSFVYNANAVELDRDVKDLGSAAILNMAVGDAAGAAGLFDAKQIRECGEVQAAMIAVRNKIQGSPSLRAKAKREIGEFKNEVDFLAMASKTKAERDVILANFGISADEKAAAADTVQQARAGGGNVNAGAKLNVPFIGPIQEKMFSRDIPEYADFKTGILIGQRAVESVRTLIRLQTARATGDVDDLNPEEGARRGFNSNPKFDQPETIAAIAFAESLNNLEAAVKEGRQMKLSPDTIHNLAKKLDDATKYFVKAGTMDVARVTQSFKHQVEAAYGIQPTQFEGPDLSRG